MFYQFLDFKSKLFIEFALMQSVPEISTKEPVESESFRDLAIFKEFLKTFPFAAKAEEDRLSASNGPVSIDLEDENLTNVQELPNNLKNNELDAKLPIVNTPTLQLLTVSFASLLPAEANRSTEAVTPLTEYIKKLSLNEVLPPKAPGKEVLKKDRKQLKKEKKEKEKKRKEKKKQTSKAKLENESKSGSISKPENRTKPVTIDKSEKRNSQSEAVKSNLKPQNEKKTNSNVEKQPSLKGVPKILARKPENEPAKTDATTKDVPVAKSPVVSTRQPYIPPSQPPVFINSTSYTAPSVDAKPFIPSSVSVTNTEQAKQTKVKETKEAKEKPKKQPKSKVKTLAERSELHEVTAGDKSRASDTTTSAPKKVAIKVKAPQKQSQPTSPKDEGSSSNSAPVTKKFFTTSAKMNESTKNQ